MGDLAFVKPERRALFDEHQRLGQHHSLQEYISKTIFKALSSGDSGAVMRLLNERDPGVHPQA